MNYQFLIQERRMQKESTKQYNKVNKLKEEFDWNIKSGIMSNHESEFRDSDYLVMKIFESSKIN